MEGLAAQSPNAERPATMPVADTTAISRNLACDELSARCSINQLPVWN